MKNVECFLTRLQDIFVMYNVVHLKLGIGNENYYRPLMSLTILFVN